MVIGITLLWRNLPLVLDCYKTDLQCDQMLE